MKKGINKNLDHYRIMCWNCGRVLFNAKMPLDLCLMMFDKLVSSDSEKVKIIEYKNGSKTVIKQFEK